VAEIMNLDIKAIDFVLAFPQAELDVPVYMEIPVGMNIADLEERSYTHVLKSKKSSYVLKQDGYNWHHKLKTAL